MACIILENNAGGKRLIPDGQPYRLEVSEKITGVDMNCGGDVIRINGTIQNESPLIAEMQNEVGGGFGDWIRTLASPIAEVMGKKGCSTCEARRIVTNAYGKLKEQHGQLKALSIIKDLWALSMKASGDEVLQKLKEILHDSHGA